MEIRKIINYLDDSLGQVENLGEVNMDNFPLYMKNDYSLQWVKVLDKNFVLATILNKEEQTINKLISRRRKIKELLWDDTSVIFVLDYITDYLRKRLIEEHLAFVIPGKQIFILELGTVFTDRINSKYSVLNSIEVKKMSPSAQVLLIFLLTTGSVSKSRKTIASALGISEMSVSRGFRELMILKLVESDFENETNFHRLSASQKEIWKMGHSFMSNPVRKSIYIKEESLTEQIRKMLVLSGESALSEHTMLSKPKNKVMGLNYKDYDNNRELFKTIPNKESDTIVIQLFNHKLFSHKGVLNELSTALTLIDEVDERVKGEIDDMLNDYFMGRN